MNKCIELSRDNRLKDWKVDIIFGYYSSILWPFGDVLNYTTKNVTFHKWIKDLYLHASADCVVCSGGYNSKHSVNHVFLSPTSIINFTSKKQSYDDTRRSSRDNELLQRAQSDL